MIWPYGRHRRLPAKNTLVVDDARAVEVAYQGALDVWDRLGVSNLPLAAVAAPVGAESSAQESQPEVQIVTPIRKDVRRRNKAHPAFIAAQPCLVFQRSACDAHPLQISHPP